MKKISLLLLLMLIPHFGVLAQTDLKSITEPVKIIFDTDMGSDCDDVGALALLHTYADMGKVEILGSIYSSGKVPYGAGIVQAINIYCGRPEIPVGANYKDDVGDSVDKMSAEKLVKDTDAFGNTIISNTDAVEQTLLNRKLLLEQPDHSVTYITVGHTKGLYDLLVSEGDAITPLSGLELVRTKVRRWVALGALGANNKKREYTQDWNFFKNGTAPFTKYLIDNLPVPMVFVDAGADVMTGKSLKQTPAGNIIRTAYRDWLWWYGKKTLDDQRPSWDLATVYYAVEGVGDYLINSGTGYLDFDPDKGCKWIPDENKHMQTYINQKDGVAKDFAAYLNMMIAKPRE